MLRRLIRALRWGFEGFAESFGRGLRTVKAIPGNTDVEDAERAWREEWETYRAEVAKFLAERTKLDVSWVHRALAELPDELLAHCSEKGLNDVLAIYALLKAPEQAVNAAYMAATGQYDNPALRRTLGQIGDMLIGSKKLH